MQSVTAPLFTETVRTFERCLQNVTAADFEEGRKVSFKNVLFFDHLKATTTSSQPGVGQQDLTDCPHEVKIKNSGVLLAPRRKGRVFMESLD